ncbi:hypothetical protein HRG_014522 [Hirsutella rhossiliensis]
MPRAASPSAASRHRLLLPPRGIAFFCRLYWLASTSAASRPRPLLPPRGPTSSRPSWHASRCLAPSAAFTGWPRLLPPCGSASFCRLAAPNFAALRPFLPPSGHDFLWTGGPRGPEELQSLELKASPGCPRAAHQSTTPPPPACYEEQARGLRRLS